MGQLESFSLEQLSIFVVAIMGACGGVMAVLFRSKCSRISCCGCTIERDPEAITDPDVQKEIVHSRRESMSNLPLDQEDPRP